MSPELLETVLAGLAVDRDLRDAITGDLLEERAALAAAGGERAADRWLRSQVLRSVPAFAQAGFRGGGFRLLAATVAAALAAMLLVGLLLDASAPLWSALVSPQAIGGWLFVALALDLAFGAAGGYLAALLGRAAPLAAAFLFGVFGLALTLASDLDGQVWYRTALVVFLVPATLTGGWLRSRRLVRRAPPA